MEEALRLAEQAAEQGEVPVGAVVVHQPPGAVEGTVVGRGHNQREALQDFSAHAELLAMRRAAAALGSWRLQHCTVYVTLEPCPMCAGAMVLGRVHRCVFGASDPKGGYLGTLDDLSSVAALNHGFEVTRGVHAEACGEVLSSFFRRVRADHKAARAREERS
ncbi:MAG: nucleoside deaminase [Alphaproteobacteria bacterium]|nr:nucleoside deaminase [Alphaproteobacteria bacterium]